MELLFTDAAQRALTEAAAWATDQASEDLEAPSLLLGLLVESECRAALILARHGIDAGCVQRQWSNLARWEHRFPAWKGYEGPAANDGRVGVRRFSSEIQASLAAARRLMTEYPRPLLLATEHLLLGLAAASHEVSDWLRQLGVDPDAIAKEIHQRDGYYSDAGPYDGPPLELPDEEKPELTFPPSVEPSPDLPNRLDEQPPVFSRIEAQRIAPPPARAAHETVGVLRVIDAAANRAREGLRVVEDYTRFVLDDRHLTAQFKQLRHDLAGILVHVPVGDRLAARETLADVGTSLATSSERHRSDLAEILAANFCRLQEALRSLEEFGKLASPDIAAEFEQLRYRTYTLQRAVAITRASLQRLDKIRLYVLLDGRASMEEFLALAQAVIAGGADAIQLRDKQLDDRQLLERAKALRILTADAGVLFIMNDRPDLAVLAGADGVHVGQEELSVKDVRTILGANVLIGVSTHSIEQARQAVLDGADYLGVGPTFPSGTKHFERFPGLELLEAVAREVRLPAFAIGGISAENLPQVLQTGIGRIAVSGAVTTAADPAQAAQALRARLHGFPTSNS